MWRPDVSAMPEVLADEESATCPVCGKPVRFKWAPGGGFVSEPHSVPIAGQVLHAKCWASIEPAGENPDADR